MKYITITLSLLLTLATSAWGSETPKHYVFLVHGIASSPKTFGPLKETLAKEALTHSPSVDWQFIDFAYETGNDSKDVLVFAEELGKFIINKFESSGGLNPQDKFSLVMHSQGGLIGLNLILKSFMNDKKYHPELKDHLDAFITLSTPYWGAKIAIFASRLLPILSYLRIPITEKFGTEELTDMQLASDFSASMREELMNPETQKAFEEIKKKSRFLIFSGVTERLNILAPFVTGKNRYEDDTAVPIPSSRLDFIYYADSDDNHNEVVNPSSFKMTNMIDPTNYVVVNAFHASPFPQKKNFPAMAKVPNRCIDVSYVDCNHPTYPMIVEHLFKLPKTAPFVRALTSFAIELKINSNGLEIDKKKLNISFKALTTGLKIGKDIELYNKVGRWSDQGDYRLYHTGYINSKKTTSTEGRVEMTITAPGFKKRVITVPVRTALSSFVELDLQKD